MYPKKLIKISQKINSSKLIERWNRFHNPPKASQSNPPMAVFWLFYGHPGLQQLIKSTAGLYFQVNNLQVLSGFDGAFSNANGTTVHKFDKSSWITRKLDRIRQQTSDTDSIVSRCLVRSHTSVIRRRRRSQGQLGSRTGSGWQAPIYHAGCAEAEKVSVTVESG